MSIPIDNIVHGVLKNIFNILKLLRGTITVYAAALD